MQNKEILRYENVLSVSEFKMFNNHNILRFITLTSRFSMNIPEFTIKKCTKIRRKKLSHFFLQPHLGKLE